MEIIEQLLVKYFHRTTTLQEEKRLKLYLTSENAREEHKKILPLFDLITYQKKITSPTFSLSKEIKKQL